MPMMSIFTAGSAQTVAAATDELLGNSHWRLDVSLTTKTAQGEMVGPPWTMFRRQTFRR
jgi:hypothetical protein